MKPLSPSDLLTAWERGLERSLSERALILLRAVDDDEINPAELPIGERDARLLSLREHIFGTQLVLVTECSKCAEAQELQIHTTDLRVSGNQPRGDLTVTCDGYEIKFRLPNSQDLCALQNAVADTFAQRRGFVHRCVLTSQFGGNAVASADLPDSVIDAISQRMSEADPQVEMELSIDCASCRNRWQESFDIVPFLWTEIHAWAIRTLSEVHQLAAGYGWSERDILSMSPLRRSYYRELLAG